MERRKNDIKSIHLQLEIIYVNRFHATKVYTLYFCCTLINPEL